MLNNFKARKKPPPKIHLYMFSLRQDITDGKFHVQRIKPHFSVPLLFSSDSSSSQGMHPAAVPLRLSERKELCFLTTGFGKVSHSYQLQKLLLVVFLLRSQFFLCLGLTNLYFSVNEMHLPLGKAMTLQINSCS